MKENNFIPPFLMIPSCAVQDKELQPTDKFILGAILYFERLKYGYCTASNATLAEIAGCSSRSTNNSIMRLTKRGYITCKYTDSDKTARASIKANVSLSSDTSNNVGVTSGDVGGYVKQRRGVTSGDVHRENIKKEYKREYKKEKKCVCGEFKNVRLKEEELQKLNEKFGEDNSQLLIEELSGYIASSGKKYKSHYATLLNWGKRKNITKDNDGGVIKLR